MDRLIKASTACVLALGLALTAGCIAVAAGAGVGTAYALGEETMYTDARVDAAADAVRKAFEEYGVAYTGTETKSDGVYVNGSKFIDDDTERVVVGVWDKGPGKQTKIEVRIGTIGKKTESLQLMALIQKHLDAAATTTTDAADE